MDSQSQQKWFKGAYDLGADRIKNGFGWPMEPAPEVIKYVQQIKPEIKRILDLGCGQGRHTLYCAGEGLEAYGVDYVARAIEEAKQTAVARGLVNAHFSVADIFNLEFSDNFFDAVIDYSVLDHVRFTDWSKYLSNVLRVLRSGGFLILFEFSSQDPCINNETRHKYEHENKPYPESLYFENDQHYDHYFQGSEIRKLFSDNFEILNIGEEKALSLDKTNSRSRPFLNALLKKL